MLCDTAAKPSYCTPGFTFQRAIIQFGTGPLALASLFTDFMTLFESFQTFPEIFGAGSSQFSSVSSRHSSIMKAEESTQEKLLQEFQTSDGVRTRTHMSRIPIQISFFFILLFKESSLTSPLVVKLMDIVTLSS